MLTWPGKLPEAVSIAHPPSTLILSLTGVFLSAFLSHRSIPPWLIPVILSIERNFLLVVRDNQAEYYPSLKYRQFVSRAKVNILADVALH